MNVSTNRWFRTGVVVAIVTAALTVWTTIVRDDGNGAGFFMLILAAATGTFAAHARPGGTARAMIGVAAMQVALTALIVTAPVTAATPDATGRYLVTGVVLAALWLAAGACFGVAARSIDGDR
ncbi:hypothetical protein [Sphingomonas sp.]|uniref:hypothetical protein n=1 Tax=Sphingomonas sp. TaxID=28214 RepID=UPI001EBDA324|nr:hypothetical protein [Sphingomonas sp.]MBX3594935.1 hypothetical protein [Sphingomonas sp.]